MLGTSDNEFSPEVPTTRGMIVTLLYRMNGSPEDVQKSSFEDVAEGSWYYNAINWASANEIVAAKISGALD